MFIQLNDQNRIVAMCDNEEYLPNAIEVDIPEDIMDDFNNYTYEDGQFIYSEAKENIEFAIQNLQYQLKETDYITAKMSDQLMEASDVSDILYILDAFKQKYGEILNQRQEWRNEINSLQSKLY